MPSGIPNNGINKGWFIKGQKISDKIKLKMIKSQIGHHRNGWKWSENSKKKFSKISKKLGRIPPSALGKKRSTEQKIMIGLAHKGEKCHFWKGGISDCPYPEDWTNYLRESIRQRDNYICQECGLHQDELTGRLKQLDIHHINYDKLNCNPENLITLCRSCHIQTNQNRDYWIKYFFN